MTERPHLFIDVDGVMQARDLEWPDARDVSIRVHRPRATMPVRVSTHLFRRLERLPAKVHLLTYWCEEQAFDTFVAQADGPRFPDRVLAPFPSWSVCGRQVVDTEGRLAELALRSGRIEPAPPPVACSRGTEGCGRPHAPQPRDPRTAHRYVADPHWKPRYIARVLAEDPRPFAWVDDEEVPVYGDALPSEGSLLIAPSRRSGLTPALLARLEAFLNAPHDDG